ncbi:MAG: TonB-dependent receptor [Acidobacteriota bacterium]
MTEDHRTSTHSAKRRQARSAHLTVLLFVLSSAIVSAQEAPLALIGATLLDPAQETATREVLVLEAGVIAQRLPELPADFAGEVLDLSGAYLTPGFNDLHVHSYGNSGPNGQFEVFGTDGVAERMLSVGVTGFLDLSGYEDLILTQRDRQRVDPSYMLGADIYSAGAAFTCPDGHGTQFPNPPHIVTSPEEARAQVKALAPRRPDVVKLIYIPSNRGLPSIDHATMVAITAEARKHDIPVVAHVDHWSDALEAVRAGVAALTHTNANPVPPELIAAMLERGTAIIPTLAVHLDLSWFWGQPERLRSTVLQRTSMPEFREAYEAESLDLRLERWRRRQVDGRELLLEAVKTFSDAGVPVLTGSDAGNPGTFQGASLHRELALLVEAGLSPWEALRATTTRAGELLRRPIGLQPGDLAHFAVFERSPVLEIANTESLLTVIHRGRLVDFEPFDLPGPAPSFAARESSPKPAQARSSSAAEGAPTVRGVVQAVSGYRLSHVDVALRDADGSVLATAKTSSDGEFELIVPDGAPSGSALEVVATYPGFDPTKQGVTLEEPVTVLLRVARFQEVVEVQALSPTDEALQPQQELNFLDIVATAGTRADPMYATQVLPGVVKLDDGSGLFVRGGDASEVATFLDRALLDHPYRNETPTGGFFGTVDAFSLQGLSLSSAGFPARYGNALSAVLDLTTREPSSLRQLSLGLGLAAASFSLEAPLGEQASVRVAGNHRDLRPMVEVNSTDLDLVDPPSGTDLAVRGTLSTSERSDFAVNAFEQRAELGSEVEEGNFAGLLATRDDNRVINASWRRSFGGVTDLSLPTFLEVTLTHSDHESQVAAGVLDIDLGDRSRRARIDLDVPIPSATLRTGLVFESVRHDSGGTLPEVGGDFGGDQGRRLWSLDAESRRNGAYFEVERSFGTRVGINLGARYDEWRLLDQDAVAPRASLSVRTGKESHLRFAWGAYHQSPENEYWTLGVESGGLRLARAEHRVVSWQIFTPSDPLHLRIEAYQKLYEDLPLAALREGEARLTSDGDGIAEGFDLYLGFGGGALNQAALGNGLTEGWRGSLSYTYLEAERLYTPWQDWSRFPLQTERFAPDFAIPHTLQLLLHKPLPWDVDGSVSARWAVGRPFTPVIGAVPFGDSLFPVFGPVNSDRVPDFARVDLALSRPFALGGSSSALVFVGVDDVFDRRNVFRYVFSEDWTEQRPARIAFGRAWYAGFTLRR